MIIRRHSLLFIGLLLILATCKWDEDIKMEYVFSGVVVDEFGKPLPSVSCALEWLDPVSTNADGGFDFGKMTEGRYNISFTKENYQSLKVAIDLTQDIRNREFVLSSSEAFLTVSDTLINSSYNSNSKEITISSNTKWSISADPWIKVSQSSGTGNLTLNVSWNASEGYFERRGTITVTSGSILRKVSIVQDPKIRIINVETIPGNQEINYDDSVYVTFNLPVTLKSLQSKYDFCIPVFPSQTSVNKNVLKFNYSCGEIGGSFPFVVAVNDSNGETYNLNFEAQFYSNKLRIAGGISDFFLNQDGDMVVLSSDGLMVISIPDLSIKKTFNPVYGSTLSYDRFHQRVYFLRKNCYECMEGTLRWLDLSDGTYHSRQVLPVAGDHPDYPN